MGEISVKVIVLESQKIDPSDPYRRLFRFNITDRISVEYVHSIYHVLQRENYEVGNDHFVLKSMFFGSYPAYVYYDSYLDYPVTPVEGGFNINSLDNHQRLLRYAIGHTTPFRLHIDGKIYDIDKLMPHCDSFSLKVSSVSFFYYAVRRVHQLCSFPLN
jgi:hypothetical protein